jgi:hypothetical protein
MLNPSLGYPLLCLAALHSPWLFGTLSASQGSGGNDVAMDRPSEILQ